MKQLYLIRHAKSSWTDPDLADRVRPLNRRGIKSCELMAAAMTQAGCPWSFISCSPALRAVETISLLSQQVQADISWQIEEDLYSFDWQDILHWLQQRDDSQSHAILVGHNPALTQLCQYLTAGGPDNLPTCGYLHIQLPELTSWSQLSQNSGLVNHLITPKMVKQVRGL